MELFTPAAAVHAGLIPDQVPLVDFGQPKVSYDFARGTSCNIDRVQKISYIIIMACINNKGQAGYCQDGTNKKNSMPSWVHS